MESTSTAILCLFLTVSCLVNIYLIIRLRRVSIVAATSENAPDQVSTEPPNSSSPASTEPYQPLEVKDLSKFVHLHRDISEEIKFLAESNRDSESLEEIRILLTQALNDCGVEEFSPSIGESFRTAFGVAPNPELILTEDVDESWTIAKVNSPGFCTVSQPRHCLQPAVVSVFKYQSNGES